MVNTLRQSLFPRELCPNCYSDEKVRGLPCSICGECGPNDMERCPVCDEVKPIVKACKSAKCKHSEANP